MRVNTVGRLDLNALRIIGVVVGVANGTRIAAHSATRTSQAPVLKAVSALILRWIRNALTIILILNRTFITKNTIGISSAVSTYSK